jgi:hypothetical protein
MPSKPFHASKKIIALIVIESIAIVFLIVASIYSTSRLSHLEEAIRKCGQKCASVLGPIEQLSSEDQHSLIYRAPDGIFSATLPSGWVTTVDGLIALPRDGESVSSWSTLDGLRSKSATTIHVEKLAAHGRSLDQIRQDLADDSKIIENLTIDGLDGQIILCGGIEFAQCFIALIDDSFVKVTMERVDITDDDEAAVATRQILESMKFDRSSAL